LGQLISSDQVSSLPLLTYFQWLGTLHNQHDGKCFGLDFMDEDSGTLQMSPVSLEIQGGELVLSLSLRYPISVTEEQLLKQLKTQLPAASRVVVTRSLPSTLFPKTHPMLKVMQEVYE
jgi:succinyl-diaminopimelate desuccinylase